MAAILVVEDNLIVQRVLGHTLRQRQHVVTTADHGVHALERLAASPFDLVIADLMMPEMDGLTLVRHLRADDRYRQLPVIMLTASGDDADRIAARAEGVDDFLTKPTSSGDLLAAVDRALRGAGVGGM